MPPAVLIVDALECRVATCDHRRAPGWPVCEAHRQAAPLHLRRRLAVFRYLKPRGDHHRRAIADLVDWCDQHADP